MREGGGETLTVSAVVALTATVVLAGTTVRKLVSVAAVPLAYTSVRWTFFAVVELFILSTAEVALTEVIGTFVLVPATVVVLMVAVVVGPVVGVVRVEVLVEMIESITTVSFRAGPLVLFPDTSYRTTPVGVVFSRGFLAGVFVAGVVATSNAHVLLAASHSLAVVTMFSPRPQTKSTATISVIAVTI